MKELEFVARLDRTQEALDRLALVLADRGEFEAAEQSYELARELRRIAREIAPLSR